jgi:ribosomal protein S18 acetylase RimI-like enzyme
VEFRPLLPSDEFASRNFFYSLKETTVYYRFFHKRNVFSRDMLQKQWAAVDYRRNMSIVGLLPQGRHKEVIAIGTYAQAEEDKDVAEVAFVVKEEYQALGIGSFMLDIMEKIAKENKYKGFTATVLPENTKMINVFKKRYPQARIVQEFDQEIEIYMEF